MLPFFRSFVRRNWIGSRPKKQPSYDKEFTDVTPWVTYSERKKIKLKAARASARKSQVRARKLEEAKGILLDVKKQFRMEVKRNTNFGWYRSLAVKEKYTFTNYN